MSKYYLMSGKHMQPCSSAFTPVGTKPIYQLFEELNRSDKLPFELELVYLSFKKGEMVISKDLSGLSQMWLDYQSNNLYGPLLSTKLRSIIDRNLTGLEGLTWIEAIVNGGSEKRLYYIPKFNQLLDVLNEDESKYHISDRKTAIPLFASNKINQYSVFFNPSNYSITKIPTNLYVNSKIKQMIKESNIQGVTFETITVL